MTEDEDYALRLEYIKGLIDRRQSISATYLTVNAAITAAIAFFFKDGNLTGMVDQVSALTLLLAGIVASSLWRRLIKQYSTLIGWWYKHVRDLEASMPDDNRAVTKEYEQYYSEAKGRAKVGITQYEVALTYVFTVLYGLFSLGIVVAIAL